MTIMALTTVEMKLKTRKMSFQTPMDSISLERLRLAIFEYDCSVKIIITKFAKNPHVIAAGNTHMNMAM